MTGPSQQADEKEREFWENLYKENCCAGCVDAAETISIQGIEVCTTPAQPLTQPPCTTSDTTLLSNSRTNSDLPLVGCAESSPIAIDISDSKQQKIVKQILAVKTLADLKRLKREWGENIVNFVFHAALTDDQKAQVKDITHSATAITIGSKVTFERHDGLMGGGTVMAINALGLATLDTTEMRPVDGLILSDGGAA